MTAEWEKIRNDCVERLKECEKPSDLEKTLMVLWVGWYSCLDKYKRLMLDSVEKDMKADAVAYGEELDKRNKE